MVSHLLVIHKFPTSVNLILHREVDGGAVHILTHKRLHFGLVVYVLEMPDHIREPNRQPIVAVTQKTAYSGNNTLRSFMIRVCIPRLVSIQLILNA